MSSTERERGTPVMSQFQKPTGWRGRLILWRMNRHHSQLTDWGLTHVTISPRDTILDLGCGGGRTVQKLAAAACDGAVYGVDYSDASVAASCRTNRDAIAAGRVTIVPASVSQLPFPDAMFDVVTAIETHFWWSDLPGGMREAFRVLKRGGRMLLVAEIYNGGRHAGHIDAVSQWSGMMILDVAEHRALFTSAGFTNVKVAEELARGWICVVGSKP